LAWFVSVELILFLVLMVCFIIVRYWFVHRFVGNQLECLCTWKFYFVNWYILTVLGYQ
jgi:hypothetical protein